jgi:predicted regulator of Ras-like GTPase activity (Roadblock/LC7/MglB family)
MEHVKTPVDWSQSSMSGLVPPRPPIDRGAWTAPVQTPITPPEQPPIDPVAVLDQLTAQVDGVAGAILASVDGFGLARSTSMADEPSHPAMLAAAVGLAHQLTTMGGGERLRQLVVDHDAGLLLVWPISSQRVLAVVASSAVDQRSLRIAVTARVAVLSGVAT